MTGTAIPEEDVFGAIMSAVFIYDGIAFATQAKVTLERAAHRADETTKWKVKPWRMNLLTPQEMADAALKDAADAHLIVLAPHQSRSLPDWLLDWLEQWAVRRHVQDGALAVFEGGRRDPFSATAMPELFRFAERHGLSFIRGDVHPTEAESSAFARDLYERAVTQTPTLLHILEHAQRDSY